MLELPAILRIDIVLHIIDIDSLLSPDKEMVLRIENRLDILTYLCPCQEDRGRRVGDIEDDQILVVDAVESFGGDDESGERASRPFALLSPETRT